MRFRFSDWMEISENLEDCRGLDFPWFCTQEAVAAWTEQMRFMMKALMTLGICLCVYTTSGVSAADNAQALTKEHVDSLMESISAPCRAEMELALDSQSELSSQCKEEIQDALMVIPNVDPVEGSVLNEAKEMKNPPGYDPNVKPKLPPKPAKLERDMRRAVRESKQFEEDKTAFATKVGTGILLATLIALYVFVFKKKRTDGKDGKSQLANGQSSGAKAKASEDWMDEPMNTNKGGNKQGGGKKKKH